MVAPQKFASRASGHVHLMPGLMQPVNQIAGLLLAAAPSTLLVYVQDFQTRFPPESRKKVLSYHEAPKRIIRQS